MGGQILRNGIWEKNVVFRFVYAESLQFLLLVKEAEAVSVMKSFQAGNPYPVASYVFYLSCSVRVGNIL